jgi:16S rRNA (adenine1518-N6/adenine1519-N6)-dimethyltransferase
VAPPGRGRPRKRFGQHFLHDPGAIDRILLAIAPRPGEHLVEIGPGRGALTRGLLEAAGRLDAVELDRDLVAPLTRACAGLGELRVHGADALAFDFCRLAAPGAPLRLVGNLPYNVSTPLLFHLLEQARCVLDMHFLLQKEVVARMGAAPGSRVYGRLSVMVQIRCAVEPLFVIGPGAFSPPPKVDSMFVRLRPFAEPPFPVRDPQALARLVALAFAQRRKTLRNALSGLLSPEAMAACGVEPGLRAEALSVERFVRLANAVAAASATPP